MEEIKPIFWDDEKGIIILDQRALPREEKYLTLKNIEEVAEAIRNLAIRGAPAIGIAAAMGVALGFKMSSPKNKKEAENIFQHLCRIITQSRPTARNLFWAIERMKEIFGQSLDRGIEETKRSLISAAKSLLEEDLRVNRAIGENGQILIPQECAILTHCNAGALATGGYGTAIGVIRAAWEAGKKIRVLVDETRPVLQGMRLTAWELQKLAIPVVIITDSMAGWFMAQGKIDLVLCGADRVARNGDTANKIGTYSLAILARAHRIPFYIAAPISTIDVETKDGRGIEIEERPEEEVVEIGGKRYAPPGVRAANPAFDITPAHLIDAIITERGILYPPFEDALNKLC
ncbi:MAG: S-methyl-5-thioribose-1-phosphate isomerase [Syntrophales bacterium]|nr:S-methyl-5-thioribose-1-phosphate isomerase [Syntrophales bacterium]